MSLGNVSNSQNNQTIQDLQNNLSPLSDIVGGKAAGKAGDINTSNTILQMENSVAATGGMNAGESFSVSFQGKIINVPNNPKGFSNCLANVIQEIMKLLIQSNSELMTTQRMGELTSLQGALAAFDEKIQAMETEKEKSYAAAFKQALGQIIGGAVQVVAATAGGILGGMGLKENKTSIKAFLESNKSPSPNGEPANPNLIMAEQQKALKAGEEWTIAGQSLTQGAGGMSSLISGATSMAAAKDTAEAKQAQIDQAKAEKVMQLWEKSNENLSSMVKNLLQEINSILSNYANMISAQSQTEKTIAG